MPGTPLFGRHRNRSGNHYDYFSCTNRAVRQRQIRCDASGHYSVPRVEDYVEQIYPTIYLSPEVMAQIRTELRDELAGRAGLVEHQAERHERTLKQIEAKQEKLVQLYYNDLVTVDVFEREQTKLKAEAKAAQRLRRIAVVQAENAEAALDEALQRLENITQVYRDGTPIERRILNRAIFKRIKIGKDGEITGTTLTPTYEALSAWNPDLGEPTNPRQTQETTQPRSVFVRPSSVSADQVFFRFLSVWRGTIGQCACLSSMTTPRFAKRSRSCSTSTASMSRPRRTGVRRSARWRSTLPMLSCSMC